MMQYFSPSEMIALRYLYVNRSVKTRRLTLVLDLDNTLMNSTLLEDLSPEEQYLLEHINNGTFDFTSCSLEYAVHYIPGAWVQWW